MSDKLFNLSTKFKSHSKCHCFDGTVLNGVSQPIFQSFVLDKPPGFEVFVSLKGFSIEKTNKSVLITITFYLEDNNYEKDTFNGATLTITLQKFKILTKESVGKHSLGLSNPKNELSKI